MLIAGAGGFAMQLFDTLVDLGLENEIVFYDDMNPGGPEFVYDKFPVLKSIDEALTHFANDNRFILGTGNPATRKMFFEKFTETGADATTIISPAASVGKYNVSIGRGSVILRGSIIESNVTLGTGTLVNLNATITHGCKLGDFCEVCPGVHLSGNVSTGEYCFLGTGSVILPDIRIGNNSVVAAGAVVIKDIPPGTMAAGIPAMIRTKS